MIVYLNYNNLTITFMLWIKISAYLINNIIYV